MTLLVGMDMKQVDPDKLGQLLEIQAQWEDRQAQKALADALANFQKDCPSILKTRRSNNAAYASLDDIQFAIKSALSSNGLSVSFDTETPEPGKLKAICYVLHSGGAGFSRSVTVPVDTQMKVNDTQKHGSAVSYCKRYAIIAALNLNVSDHEDDDGAAAGTATISAIEADEISTLLDKFNDRELVLVSMLEWVGVESISQIPSAKIGAVLANLKKKLKA